MQEFIKSSGHFTDTQGQINARFTVRRQMSSWKQFAILATFRIKNHKTPTDDVQLQKF